MGVGKEPSAGHQKDEHVLKSQSPLNFSANDTNQPKQVIAKEKFQNSQ